LIDDPSELPNGLPAAIFQVEAIHNLRIPTPNLFFIAKGTDALILSKVWAVLTEIINSARYLYQIVFMRAHYFPDLSTGVLIFASSIRRLKTEKSQA